MPNQMIGPNWRASDRTIKSLIDAGYTDEQWKRILIKFIKQHGATEVESPSTLYNKWVRFENAHGISPDMAASRKIDKDRAKAIANRSDDSHEKAEAAKTIDSGKMSDEDALIFYMKDRG